MTDQPAPATDPLAAERAYLADLETKPLPRRWGGYLKLSGPGFLQSAMTLGGGTAFTSLLLATYDYRLLWVAPLGMIMGVVMLSALSYQTLSTGERPFEAVRKHVSPALAWAWVLTSLGATVIWHFAQYGLLAGMGKDLLKASGVAMPKQGTPADTWLVLGIGAVVLCIAIWIVFQYSKGHRGIRIYETVVKSLVWMIVAILAVVVIMFGIKGKLDAGQIFSGYIPNFLPEDPKGIEKVIGALGASVGINMTFLFGYSQLSRGWGREHRGLARFDLAFGMLVPFTIATSLLVIAAATAFQGKVAPGAQVRPDELGAMFVEAGMPAVATRIVFDFGICAMLLSCITMHMLCCGFCWSEALKFKPEGWKYKLACLTPCVGVFGVLLWSTMGAYVAPWTSAICWVMLPIAYIAFFLLNNKKKYLGEDKPKGPKGAIWNLAMLLIVLFTLGSTGYFFYAKYGMPQSTRIAAEVNMAEFYADLARKDFAEAEKTGEGLVAAKAKAELLTQKKALLDVVLTKQKALEAAKDPAVAAILAKSVD
ncbi:MAG: divalent metal cation transporter, partial [Phycisphaerales bacterium]|nr:divalent metal cation transporter [Phycisphaerales bacterium]